MCLGLVLGFLAYAIADYFLGHWRVTIAKDKDDHWCVIVFNIDEVAPRQMSRQPPKG